VNATIIGIDCAVSSKNLGLALGTSSHSGVILEKVVAGPAKDPAELIVDWIAGRDEPVLFAVDAPLGWPVQLAEALIGFRAGEALEPEAHALFRRFTDDFVCARLKKRPLDVGADKIARTAHAALRLLSKLRRMLNRPVPLAWSPALSGSAAIEVYPAATLRAYDMTPPPANRRRTASWDPLLRELAERIGLPAEDAQIRTNRDAIDAAICVLAGHDFLNGKCFAPPPERLPVVKREGWIWVRDPAFP
jgi:predicted RNase H-like nuclease